MLDNISYKDYFNENTFRYDVINSLISKYNLKDYLEIGVEGGYNFSRINCEHKMSVDPQDLGYTTCKMPSDDFFRDISNDKKWDIIFVDGLHEYEQCYRDIVNAANHLEENGFIVCHDMNPIVENVGLPYPLDDYGMWNGDVYKSFIKFRQERLDFSGWLIYDSDMGLGIFRRGIGQKILCDVDNLTFEEWNNNKGYLMNCISLQDFTKFFL